MEDKRSAVDSGARAEAGEHSMVAIEAEAMAMNVQSIVDIVAKGYIKPAADISTAIPGSRVNRDKSYTQCD